MDPISPVITDAFRLLRTDLYGHLDQADELALRYDEWTEQEADWARKLIPELVRVIRSLLIEHEVTPHGNCQICPSMWPCPVVTTIHALIKDPDRAFAALALRAHNARTQWESCSCGVTHPSC